MKTGLGSAVQEDVWIPSVCYMCQNCCGILVHRVNGVVVKIEGDPSNPHNKGRTCAKGHSGIMSLYHPKRVLKPLKRTNPEKGIGVDPRWQEITWEEALDETTARLKAVRDKDPRSLLISTFDYQALRTVGGAFAGAYGTPNVTSGSAGYYCGNGYHPLTYLNHGAFFSEPDLDYCNYLVMIGSQNGFVNNTNPMGLTQKMADARIRGMHLVVIDPICSHAAAKADEWLPIRPGTDAALCLGITNILLNELGLFDRVFLQRYTNAPYLIGQDGKYVRDPQSQECMIWDSASDGPVPLSRAEESLPALEGEFMVGDVPCRPSFTLLKEHVRRYTPERVEEITTVPAATVTRLARELGKAAQIGSTKVIDGVELPYRPVCVNWNRGPIAHKHAMHNGMAMQLLNSILGAVDVPGGHLGCCPVGPNWEPEVGPDGLLIPADEIRSSNAVYPPRRAKQPETLELMELFPVAIYGRTVVPAVLLNPARFGLPYRIEAMIHTRNNYLMSSADPDLIAAGYSNIPFTVTFANLLEESTYLADIVLPDTHYLERLDMNPNLPVEWILAGEGEWYYMLRQPVVSPPPGVRHWAEVLFELADRLGMRDDFYRSLNVSLGMKDPWSLLTGSNYTYSEVLDRWAKSRFGPERGLDWFKEHGVLTMERNKTVMEAYPRVFLKPRIPIYLEHFLGAGEETTRVIGELGLNWDMSDYTPLPDWKPCAAFSGQYSDYDLFVVNSKLPFHAHTYTAENPWLAEISSHYAYRPDEVLINRATAQKKGIADGDSIQLVTNHGKQVVCRARLTECVHPEVLGTFGLFGKWSKGETIAHKARGVHFNALISYDLDRNMDPVSAGLDSCVKVKVTRMGGRTK